MPNRSFIATGPFSQICQKESLPQALLASVTMILAKFQSWSPPVYPKNAFGMLKFKRPFYQFVYGLQGARKHAWQTTDCMLLACDSHEQQSYACHVSDLAGVADAAANA